MSCLPVNTGDHKLFRQPLFTCFIAIQNAVCICECLPSACRLCLVGLNTYGVETAVGIVRPRILLLIGSYTLSISNENKETEFVVFIFFL